MIKTLLELSARKSAGTFIDLSHSARAGCDHRAATHPGQRGQADEGEEARHRPGRAPARQPPSRHSSATTGGGLDRFVFGGEHGPPAPQERASPTNGKRNDVDQADEGRGEEQDDVLERIAGCLGAAAASAGALLVDDIELGGRARATGAATTGSSSMRILRRAVMANSCFFGLSEAFCLDLFLGSYIA